MVPNNTTLFPIIVFSPYLPVCEQKIPAAGLVLLLGLINALTSSEVDEIPTQLISELQGAEFFKQQTSKELPATGTLLEELATPSLYEQQKTMYKSMVVPKDASQVEPAHC